MVLISTVTVWLMDRNDNRRSDYALMLVLWILPVAVIALAIAPFPGSAIPVLALAGRLFWRLWQQERDVQRAAGAAASQATGLALRAQ